MADGEAAGTDTGTDTGTETDTGSGSGTGTGTGPSWRRPHGPLQRYYGLPAAEAAEAAPDPIDINGPHFDPEVYLAKVTFDPAVTRTPTPGTS